MGLKDLFNKFVFRSKSVTRDALYPLIGTQRNLYSIDSPKQINDYLYIFKNDPEVNTAITVRVNAIMASGYTIEGNARSSLDKGIKLLKRYGFNKKLLRKILYNLILYDHVFIEVDKEARDLKVVETSDMEIIHDKHGNIERYIQKAPTGEEIEFSTDEIVYIKTTDISSSLWGVTRLEALRKTVLIKGFIEQHLLSLSSRFAWRDYMRFSDMSDEEIKSALSYLKNISERPDQPFVLKAREGNFEVGKLRDPREVEYFLGLLNYLRQQIFMLLRVPPIVVGLPDNSNRSNSDAQIKTFNIENQSIRDLVQESFNEELFPKMGVGYVEFSWNPIDKRSEKDDIEIAERLINMGAKPSKVEEFLRKTGLELPEGELFKEDVKPKKSEDLFPSRQRKDKTEMSTQIGTGEDGTTREDQLVMKSKYWVYDAYVEDE